MSEIRYTRRTLPVLAGTRVTSHDRALPGAPRPQGVSVERAEELAAVVSEFCPNCGKPVAVAHTSFCAYCGHALSATDQEGISAPSSMPGSPGTQHDTAMSHEFAYIAAQESMWSTMAEGIGQAEAAPLSPISGWPGISHHPAAPETPEQPAIAAAWYRRSPLLPPVAASLALILLAASVLGASLLTGKHPSDMIGWLIPGPHLTATAQAVAQAHARAQATASTGAAIAAATADARVQATATRAAAATATALPLVPYSALTPGPGCDRSGGEWTTDNASGVVCLADRTQLVVNASSPYHKDADGAGGYAETQIAYVRTPFVASYSMRLDIANEAQNTSIYIYIGSHAYSYSLSLLTDYYDAYRCGSTGTSSCTRLTDCSCNASGSHSLALTFNGPASTIALDGQVVASYQESAPTAPTYMIIGINTVNGVATAQADFRNFVYSPTR